MEVRVIDARNYDPNNFDGFAPAEVPEEEDLPLEPSKISINNKKFKKKKQMQKQSSGGPELENPKTETPIQINFDIPNEEPKTNEVGWFVDDSDRLFNGIDYATKEDDFFRLVKHLKNISTKTDLLRYQTEYSKS